MKPWLFSLSLLLATPLTRGAAGLSTPESIPAAPPPPATPPPPAIVAPAVVAPRTPAPVARLELGGAGSGYGGMFAQAAGAPARAAATVSAAPWEPEFEGDVARLTAKLVGDARQPGRNLVVRSTPTEPSVLAAAEEDLSVMARILEKAVDQSAEGRPKASGIDLFVWSGSGGARNLALEGHGAVFLLKVKFPLAPPATKTEETKPKEPGNTEWDQARRELYGRRELEFDVPKAMRRLTAGAAEPYDEARVERLKASLLDALKNGSHLRIVQPNETVTVVVSSEAGGNADVLSRRIVKGSGAYVVEEQDAVRTAERPASVLTLQARKADLDAFAKGKLDREDFQKKVKVLLY